MEELSLHNIVVAAPPAVQVVPPASGSSETNYLNTARKNMAFWVAAATPFAMYYYKSQPAVPSILRWCLFSFIVGVIIFFIGTYIHEKVPRVAKLLVGAGVFLGAMAYVGAFMSLIM